jgi:hypothetical protein
MDSAVQFFYAIKIALKSHFTSTTIHKSSFSIETLGFCEHEMKGSSTIAMRKL